MENIEQLLERSSKAARLRRRRERRKKKDKLARKLHAKNTKTDPYAEAGAAGTESEKQSKSKGIVKGKADFKSKLKSLQTVHKTNIKPKHAEAPKALNHLARQKRPIEKRADIPKHSKQSPRTPEYHWKRDKTAAAIKKAVSGSPKGSSRSGVNWQPDAARSSGSGPRDRISQRKRSNIKPTKLGVRVAKNLMTMESILAELQVRVDEKHQKNMKEGGHVKSTKSRVTSKPTIADALRTMKHGDMFSTPKSDRIYVVTNAVWGQKSGSGKVAKGFSHSPAFSKIKGYSERTKKKYGSKNKKEIDKNEKS